MSARAVTPADGPIMAPPATPGSTTHTPTPATPAPTASETVPSTPSGRGVTLTPKTPGSTSSPAARTPGGTLKVCTMDPEKMTKVKVHTAKCTECDKRNKDTMLRCPGCTFQICKPCCDRRERSGKSLEHGTMLSPGGLNLLGSGGSARRSLLTPASKRESAKNQDVKQTDAAKVFGDKAVPSAEKLVPKRRAGKIKSKEYVDSESSEDDFKPDLGSPSAKRRRSTVITSSPTATSMRPSRSTATTTFNNSASSNSDASASTSGPNSGKSTTSTLKEITAPSHLIEKAGVDTPDRRYDEHLLLRHEPIMSNRTAVIPTGKPPGPLAKHEEPKLPFKAPQQANGATESAPQTVRAFVNAESAKYHKTAAYHDENVSEDELDELLSTIKAAAREWALSTYDNMSLPQTNLKRGLDMRLDLVDQKYTVQLSKTLETCYLRKMEKFAKERVPASAVENDGVSEHHHGGM
ncbi:hypothetical protein GQ44DRAFT_806582 [Phaeosphaeriaceae sp. PMI808]|nr:hypothetical protein GQ44DRAFT_806582 [Phaeosphaeriaceae sp. PMI808]